MIIKDITCKLTFVELNVPFISQHKHYLCKTVSIIKIFAKCYIIKRISIHVTVEIAKRGTCTRTITASIKSLSGVIKNKPGTPHSPHPKNETGFCMFESDNKHSLSIELYIHVTICS